MHVSAKDLSMARVREREREGEEGCAWSGWQVGSNVSPLALAWHMTRDRAPSAVQLIKQMMQQWRRLHAAQGIPGTKVIWHLKRVNECPTSAPCSALLLHFLFATTFPNPNSNPKPNRTEPNWTVLKHIEGRTPRLMWWLPVSVIPFGTVCSGRVREWKLALRSPVASMFHLSCDWLDNWLFE